MGPRRILVIEDNPKNLKLVRDVLTFSGFEVIEATYAEEALSILEHSQPRMILMDLQLPGMDGLTLTRRLKADPATAGIAIVALTAHAMKGDEQKARAAGCDGYITKPINTRTLHTELVHLLAARKP